MTTLLRPVPFTSCGLPAWADSTSSAGADWSPSAGEHSCPAVDVVPGVVLPGFTPGSHRVPPSGAPLGPRDVAAS